MAEFDRAIYSLSLLLVYLGMALVLFAAAIAFTLRVAKVLLKLIRHSVNPVISPTLGSGWDEVGTFNPAAMIDDKGLVHLIYRAVGHDGMSRFGYAVSGNARDIDDKSPYPVFTMFNPRKESPKKLEEKKFDPVMYPSGGSWGGSEDPRMVRLGGKVYVTFSAFDGWDFIRITAISISEKDFLAKKWKWSKPSFLSPPGQIHKNWVLFP